MVTLQLQINILFFFAIRWIDVECEAMKSNTQGDVWTGQCIFLGTFARNHKVCGASI